MFRKNKKIFKFLIGALILSLPATLKVSAMEQKPQNEEYENIIEKLFFAKKLMNISIMTFTIILMNFQKIKNLMIYSDKA